MSMIHGAWVDEHFFLWGEVWRRHTTKTTRKNKMAETSVGVTGVYPFAMTADELQSLLQVKQPELNLVLPKLTELFADKKGATSKRRSQASLAKADGWSVQTVAIPTVVEPTGQRPQLSNSVVEAETELFPWQIAGLQLSRETAMPFLGSLPLSRLGREETFLSDDLRFWSHLSRWGFDLIARGKYLPRLIDATKTSPAKAVWQVLLDSATDQERLNRFAKQMPTVCRLYGEASKTLAMPRPVPGKELITQFLDGLIDVQMRQMGLKPKIQSTLQPLLAALTGPDATIEAEIVAKLGSSFESWLAPFSQAIDQFRVCLTLVPPIEQTIDKTWILEYGLQAIDDITLVIPAAVLWQNPVDRISYAGHIVERPQETLLAGLGVASRIYSVLEDSLCTGTPMQCVLDPAAAYQFLREMAGRLQEGGIGIVLPPSLANREGWANRLGLKVQATTTNASLRKKRLGMQGLLNFEWELAIGGHSLSKREFDRLVSLGTPLVEINGEWVELRPQDIRSAKNFFAARKDQTKLTLEDALRLSSGDTQTMEKLPVVSFESSGALQELVTNLGDNEAIGALNPKHLQGELRPYQARGVGWLSFLEKWGLGACLADDMGLGKTLQLIAFVLHLQEQKLLEAPILIVCPTSVLGNWEREVKRFAPSLSVMVQHGDKRSQGKAFVKIAKQHNLVITSYALVHRDMSSLKLVDWQSVVLDEAQNIKNSESKQSQSVRQLDAPFRVALTGTPVENRLSELWSIMDFLNPGYLGPKNYFQRRFAIPIERYGDMTSLQALRSLAQPFILRRLKTDKTIIQDLPEKNEMTAFCSLTLSQADLYQQMVDETLEKIDASKGIQRKGLILGLLTKLKQICNHPGLITGDVDMAETTFPAQSGKLQRLDAMLDEALAEGDRALIFTQFAEWGKLLQAYLTLKMKQDILFLYGGTRKNQREAMVDRFQHDPQAPQVFILSLKAGGVGLNLTRANHVFHFDRWWNPAVENQATDRVFRIGQVRNVQVHKFVCTGTLEERIHDMIEGKKALAEQVIGTGENWLGDLDTDQLRELLLLDRSTILGEE
ncbi:DEAD/DEAH box helicase [filamentous cyanobacterium LEGE 11480]|uniref:DEAD/DEAH box helicase n=1 Tax=Romeriopsis navalis LEGE 11480 TaxID=2777977 RepID=A0A928VR55_9CYAN|nr:DEAD/DEAH box helicase [Romeriopsis navalis]MBE9031027.1 DEAD/DEAH box helicase [Romeriopsis navalis LEGE 11480]